MYVTTYPLSVLYKRKDGKGGVYRGRLNRSRIFHRRRNIFFAEKDDLNQCKYHRWLLKGNRNPEICRCGYEKIEWTLDISRLPVIFYFVHNWIRVTLRHHRWERRGSSRNFTSYFTQLIYAFHWHSSSFINLTHMFISLLWQLSITLFVKNLIG